MKTTSLFCIVFLVLCACKKEIQYKAIDFSYADDYAGTYDCIVTEYVETPYPSDYLDTQYTATINVTDMRDGKQCLFYIDYFDDTVIAFTNGYFYKRIYEYSPYPFAYVEINKVAYFKNDSIYFSYYHKTHYTKMGNASFINNKTIKGAKQ